MKEKNSNFVGEFMGTYILVLFGTGTVAVSVLYKEYQSIFQIAIMWGVAVIIGIYATRNICCAHFNPAVSIAMVATGRMKATKLPIYLIAQFSGAFCAGLSIYGFFHQSIADYESINAIVRGTPESMSVAKMFGEYYRFAGQSVSVSMGLACMAEGMGTFLLVLMIFCFTEGCNAGRPSNNASPVIIGITLSSVICLFGPLTQAGFNPARDFAPRMVSLLFGWGKAAFPDQIGGFFFVYMLAPVVGGLLAGFVFTKIIEPAMLNKKEACDCVKK